MARELADTTARQELVQPSLWDRLVDELPGVVAETDSLRADLSKELSASYDLEQIIQGGARAVEKCTDLSDETRQRLHVLVSKSQNRRKLEETGILVDADTLREAVRRDIEMLFNIERMEADFLLTPSEQLRVQTTEDQLADFPNVRSSVINYGVPSFSGRRGSDFDKDALERELRDVLQTFEPRLKPNSVKVKITINDKTGMRIGIDGILLLSPVPERLRLSTAIDLDNGQATTTLEDA
jgi:type VI secretion system protein ImpF